MVYPTLIWRTGYDLPSDVPDIAVRESPLAEGAVDKIVRAQTLLGWGILGLLLTMLLKVIRRDK
jgi:hypothetical protein